MTARGMDWSIAVLGVANVRTVLNSGHAADPGHPDSFRGRAATCRIRHQYRASDAYTVLASEREAVIRQACRSEQELREAFLEGSGRAMNEMRRRGLRFPVNAEMSGAWL